MLTYIQAIILGAIQGATELFPVSSLGHSVILPQILGWNVNQDADFFLNFLVATHLATSLVLFAFYFKDWMKIVAGIFRSLIRFPAQRFRIDPADTYARLGWLLILATIPAGLLGLLFEHKLKLLFASPTLIAGVLVLNGLLLYGVEFLTKKQFDESAALGSEGTHSDADISQLSWKKSFGIGCAQVLALFPGFSRTGATVGGGLFAGLNHKDAARFSFLLATPIIFAAALLKVPGMFKEAIPGTIGVTVAGTLASAVCAYLSVKFLTKYFENKTLKPFAGYCVIAGSAALLLLLVR